MAQSAARLAQTVFVSETAFRTALSAALERLGHEVRAHEGDRIRGGFTVRGARAFVDLYVRTNARWRYHEYFPVLGIETKLPHQMNWLIDAIDQVGRYADLERAEYWIDGKRAPAPSIFLVVTPESWAHGIVYHWRDARLNTPESKRAAALVLTTFYKRLLWRHGASLLEQGRFQTNKVVVPEKAAACAGGPYYHLA